MDVIGKVKFEMLEEKMEKETEALNKALSDRVKILIDGDPVVQRINGRIEGLKLSLKLGRELVIESAVENYEEKIDPTKKET